MIKVLAFGLYIGFYGLLIILGVLIFEVLNDIFGDEIRERFRGDRDDGT